MRRLSARIHATPDRSKRRRPPPPPPAHLPRLRTYRYIFKEEVVLWGGGIAFQLTHRHDCATLARITWEHPSSVMRPSLQRIPIHQLTHQLSCQLLPFLVLLAGLPGTKIKNEGKSCPNDEGIRLPGAFLSSVEINNKEKNTHPQKKINKKNDEQKKKESNTNQIQRQNPHQAPSTNTPITARPGTCEPKGATSF